MADFNRNRRPSGGRSFGGGRDFSRGGDRPMFDAICGNCGKACQVPFRPSGDRPVLCSDCFRKSGGPERSEGRDFSRPRFENRPRPEGPNYNQQFDALNQKLDKIIQLLTPAVYTKEAPVVMKEKKEEKAVEQKIEPEIIVEPVKKKRVKKIVPLTPEEQTPTEVSEE